MTQAILPTAISDVQHQNALPAISYKGNPVITTEALAQAYGCTAKNIHMNFANNRERFKEGKHFYTLTNGDLKAFRDYTKNLGLVVPARSKHFTIYTEWGSLYHAKSIGTDQAWLVYEVLVETFFRVVKPEPQPALESAATPSTAEDRKPLRSLVFAWSKAAGVHIDTCWPQVKAHFQLSRLDDLPVEWIPDALAFVQAKIDALPKALPEPPKSSFDYWNESLEMHKRICYTATVALDFSTKTLNEARAALKHAERLVEEAGRRQRESPA